MSHSITRRQFVEGSVGVASAFATACASAPTERRPNIVLLMGDDHGWEETGYNGNPYLQTPVLDEMAATGLRMDCFHSASPVCSPTRGSVLTGRHPNRYGTFNPNRSFTFGMLLCSAVFALTSVWVISVDKDAFKWAIHAFLAVVGLFYLIILYCPKALYRPEDLAKLRDETDLRDEPHKAFLLALLVMGIYLAYQIWGKN